MMGFKSIHSTNNLRSILKKFFTLAIILTVINVSEEKKISDEDFQGIKNDPETVAGATAGNVSKASNIKKIADDRSSSRAVIKNRENSPALKSFLRNVLQAQDELKWIDQAVRRVGAKDTQEKSLGYSSKSLIQDSGSRHRAKNRLKRLSAGNELYEIESWPSPRRKYHDYEDAGNLNQSIYPEEEDEEDEELKVKRSTLDEGSAPAVDDATLRRWARREGLKVPGGWFEYEEGEGGSSERVNRMKDSIEPRWVENPAREENVGEVSGKNSEDSKAGGEPTLESLKRTVLELSRSLAESDRKMEELGKRRARNRERHVEDLAGRKEGRSKGEHERAMPNYAKESSAFEDSNWWDDPRSAAEIFDFERRDDGEMDEEDEDDDPETGNSELDYMMQRVKREDGDQDGVRVRVYRRAGFGGSYLEPGERGKRSGSEREPEENEIEKNSLGGSGSYGAGVSEIRGTGLDKIINGENFDGGEGFSRGGRNVNENEKEDNFGGEDKVVMNKREEKLNAEKGAEGGTVGDSNLEELKTTAASLSADEKRSSSLRGRREESRQILSAPEAETPPDQGSSSNRIKSRLDGLLKNAAPVPPDKKIIYEKYSQDIMPGKIGQRNDEVYEKLAEDSNDSKKDEGPNRRDSGRESKAQEKVTDHIDQDSEEPKGSNGAEVSEKIVREEKFGNDESNEEENLKGEEKLVKLSGEKDSEFRDKLDTDSKIENKDNKDDENGKSNPIDQDTTITSSKVNETLSEKDANLSSNEDKKFGKTDLKKGPKETIKREESTRKLLWISSDRLGSKDFKETRDGRRDSAWDHSEDGKTDEQPSNNLDNSSVGLKFMKRSLMAVGNRSLRNNASDKSRWRRKIVRKGRKRSVKSYPENMEDDNAMEEIAREDKEDVHRSYAKKRSLKKPTEYRKERDVAEELYQVKYQGFSEDDEAARDSGVRNQGWESASVMESETQNERSLVGSSHRDGDRDPIRDRINMLIKQKLDDRGKEKQAHLKREVGAEARNIEYYDYEGDVGRSESEVGSSGSDNDQPHNVTSEETSTSTTSEAPSTTSEAPSTDSSESMNKKDEITEEERKQALQHEEMNNRDAKEEFIPDSGVTTTQKRLPQVGETTVDGEPSEGDQNRSKDEEMKNILRGAETGDENNGRRENEIQKSNYDRWLAQPAEASPEEQDASNISKDRYQENEEPKERDRPVENGNTDVLEEPFDYSVNGNEKIEPDSLDDVLREKSNTKEREEDPKDSRESGNNERDQENPVDNYKSNDEPISADDRWKYEEIRDKTRPDDGQRVEDEEIEGRSRNEKLSRRHWSSKDSGRIEEENNGEGSSEDFFSSNSEDQDQIFEDENHSKEIVDEDNTASREARLIGDSAEDSLPTMLDRSGPKNLAPGKRTYLMIAPDSELECPRKRTNENVSSSPSGSNYFALKTTDDMFKGGIEQSNPSEDKIAEADIMRKTTTEWRMGDDARAKPVTGRYPSAPLDDEEVDGKRGSNSLKKFPLIEYQELGLNPRDVVHESIVDPEEMSADFDDDLMPRLGRSLQSVSYPNDPFDGAGEGKSRDEERPAEKYLENTQIGFERKDGTGSEIEKREMVEPNEIDASHILQEDKYRESDAESGLKKTAERNPRANKDSELTIKNVEVDGAGETVAKRYSEASNRDDDHRIDKDKRGLTNVEEWEMNAPDVQKQRTMTRSAENGAEDFSGDEREKNLEEENNEKLDSTLKTEDEPLPDFESHERETRSIQSKNPNPEFYAPHVDIGERSDMRSKIRRKKKFNQSYLSKSEDPLGSNFRDNWSNERGKIGDNSLDDIGNIRTRRFFKKRSGSSREKKKSNGKESSFRKREPANGSSSSSKRDKLWDQGRGNRKKIVKEGATNRRHSSSRDVKKRRGGSPLKKVKNRKDVLRGGNAKDNNGMVSTATEDSLVAPKAFDSGMRGVGERRVLDESAEDGGDNAGRDNNEDDKNEQKKKFKTLLSADNMEDESQMDLALHGELAGKIVEKIFDQVQKNNALKLGLGPGLFRKHKSEDSVESDKIYRQGLDEDEVKHTEEMMRRVMELLGRLVLDEVQRKTCASLPPDMREFLQWMLGVEDEYRSSDEAPPLPLVHSQEPNHRQGDKFLFGGQPGNTESGDLDELNKKVKLLKALINEYNSLSSKEKTKVQTVHDYLVKQLELLMRYIEAKEGERGVKGGDVGFRGGNILQYQNAGPNSNDSIASQSTLPPLVHTPSILMLSNASFGVDHPYRSVIPEHFSLRRREARSSEHGLKKRAKKRKKHKKHKSRNKQKHKDKKKHGKRTGGESLQYKKLIRKAALLRKKRADLYEDDWDPVDSGYEEPAIYNSSGELANGVDEQRSSQKAAEDNEKRNDPYFWSDVLSGKSNDDGEANDGKSPALDGPQEESNGSLSFAEEVKINGETAPVKRDVLSASVALQPWINPKPNDQVSREYFDKLTEELVHKVSIPPIYSTTREDEENKRKVRGRSLAEDEVMLLSKRDAWKVKNEQQLEEVAFGKDMRGKWKDEERFKKLTEMDRKKNEGEGTKREKREGPKGSAKEGGTVNERIENGRGNGEGEVVTAALGEDNVGEDFGATGETVNSVSEKVRNFSATGGSEKSVRESEVPRMIEGLQSAVPKIRLVNSIPDPTKGGEQKDGRKIASLEDVGPEKEDYDSLQEKGKSPSVSRLVLPWEKKNSKISDDNEEGKNGFRNRLVKKEFPVIEEGVKGSAIPPSLEVSSKQKQLASKDDHRDPDDRTLGLESPFIIGLNTY